MNDLSPTTFLRQILKCHFLFRATLRLQDTGVTLVFAGMVRLLVLIPAFVYSLQLPHLKYFDQHYKEQKKRTDRTSVPFERITQLYSRSCGGHVQVIGTHVDAKGKDGGRFGK